ncbi:hypothetical protein STEG23_022934 [Scotinomys teguina]
MAAQKINEGLEHLAKAEKYLKTGFLKWKPDYDSAASEYGKAAVAFKNAKQFEQAKDACLREAVAHENNRALFHAAKAYEQAGMMLKEMQKLPEAVQLIEKASMMYLENGTPDTAAMALERAGKLIENIDPEKAVQLYQQTASVFEPTLFLFSSRGDRPEEHDEGVKQLSLVKESEEELSVVCASRSIPGFNGSEDCAALEQLLEGYDQQDQDQVSDVCNSPLFKYMDNDYAKLGLSLVVPGGGMKKKSPATPQAKPDGAASIAAEEEEDEYSGGLC